MSDSTINFLLKSCARRPLLNASQEITLSREIRAWLQADNPDRATVRRGKRAKQKMIEANMRLAVNNAKKYTKRIDKSAAVSLEDLIQEAMIGLNRASELFDPERGYKFSTYCTLWINQSIRRFVEIQQSPIKISNHASQLAMRWRYKPKDMTIEEFAESENRTVENIREYLQAVNNAQAVSLDAHCAGSSEEDGSLLLDFVASNDAELEESDWTEAVQGLNEIDEIKDAMALVDLSMQTKPAEMAEFLECSTPAARKKLNDAKSVIREHAPSHIRERICGKEQKGSVKLEVQKPVPQPHVARELVLVGCNSNSESMPEAISAPSTNGHHQSLEAEALAVIETVKAEPEAAAQPKRRARRSKEEMAAAKAQGLISVSVDGCSYEGSAADVAQLINALRAA